MIFSARCPTYYENTLLSKIVHNHTGQRIWAFLACLHDEEARLDVRLFVLS
jgi:hypothetical protein